MRWRGTRSAWSTRAAGRTARHSGPARVGVVTTTGGGAAMVVDQLGVRGLKVDRFVDLTLAGTVNPDPSTLARVVGVSEAGAAGAPHHTGERDQDTHPRYHEERD